MKIYFAGSIRGGRDDVQLYLQIIEHLKTYGEVLTEHIGDKKLSLLGEDGLTDEYIHKRDLGWVLESDVMVAEVSTPSLGTGYEIGRGIENEKNILCLYRPQDGKRLSAMIAGCPDVRHAEYRNIDEAKQGIDIFFTEIKNSSGDVLSPKNVMALEWLKKYLKEPSELSNKEWEEFREELRKNRLRL